MELDDYIVRMPPLKSYPVRIKIKDVRKGKPRFVLEDEVKDAMEICNGRLANEMRCWDELSDEALVEFERLVEQSEPWWCRPAPLMVGKIVNGYLKDQSESPHDKFATFLDKLRYWTLDDWIDYLRGVWCG